MTSSTGRPSNPPLALTSSRQISSAVLITLLGAAPAPVTASLLPLESGLPFCAGSPEMKRSRLLSARPRGRSALRQISFTTPFLSPSLGGPLLGLGLRRHFIGPPLFPTCPFPPVARPN